MKKIIFTLSLFLGIQLMLSAQIDEQFITRHKEFGNAVAIDGDWAIVGNMWEGRYDNGGIEYSRAGAVYIFRKQPNGLWTQHSFLTEQCWFPETGEQHGMNYGRAVDIYGDWAVVGADYDSDGTGQIGPDGVVFVYKYNSSIDTWSLYAELAATDNPGETLSPVNDFGSSVSVSEGIIVVGDPDWGITDNGFPDRGAIYVYRSMAGAGWQFEERILADDGWANQDGSGYYGDNFGFDVAALSDNKIVVGAPWKGVVDGYLNRLGKIYVYEKDPVDGWEVTAELYDGVNWPAAGIRELGYSVDIVDGLIVAGAPESNAQTGALFVLYDNGAGNWTPVELNVEASWQEGDRYGHDVSVAKNNLDDTYTFLVGVPGDDGENNNQNRRGLAVKYETALPVVANNLVPVSLLSQNIVAENEYGQAVAIDNLRTNCVIGAWLFDAEPGDFLEGAVAFFSFAEAFEGIWEGTIDTDWTNPGNWSDGSVPNGNTSVIIADDAVNMPVLNTLGFCLNLSLDINETLTLDGYGALLHINGDATILGEFIIPEGENSNLARLEVQGDFYTYCEKDKQLPAGTYYGDLEVESSAAYSNFLNQAGDVFVYGRLVLGNKGKLQIDTNYLELHDLVWGVNPNGLYSTMESSLTFMGEPVIAIDLSRNIKKIKNLTINNIKGINKILYGSLYIYGTLNLMSGEFKVRPNAAGGATLYLYNTIAGNDALFVTYSESRLFIMGEVANIELPSSLAVLDQLIISNPNSVILNSDIFINQQLYLESGDIDNNGYQIGFGPDGEYMSGTNVVINDNLFDPDNPPSKIWVKPGASVVVDGVVEVENLDINGGARSYNQYEFINWLSRQEITEDERKQQMELWEQTNNGQREANAAGSLTINPVKGLTVNNQININGNFVLKSSLAGNGSFIDNTNGPSTVSATVETYMSAGRWHYVSPSVEQATAEAYYVENGSNIWMKTFNEATNQWEYISSLSYPLTPGKGYAVWVDPGRADEIVSYEGALNKGDEQLNLSYSGLNKGWNLIGNPFPSSLEWNAASWNPQNTSGVVVVYDNGNYVYSNTEGNGTLANNIIPPGQGFFVQAVSANASIKLPQGSRVHSNQSFYKQVQSYTDAMVVTVSSADKRDKIWISFNPEASDEFELGRDARRLQGDAGVPKLYTRFGDQQLAINVLGQLVDQKSVPLYLEPAQSGNFQLEFSYLESFMDTEIWLEDHATGEMISLNEHSLYNFEALAGAEPHRFSLHFDRTVTSLEPALAASSDIKVYSAAAKLIVDANQEFGKASLTIYSLNGKFLYQQDFSGKKPLVIDANPWLNQLVVVSILSNTVQENYKVFIQ